MTARQPFSRVAIDRFEGIEERPGVPKNDPILVADAISRRFGGLTAVSVDHCEIERGAITALIGPNGAGKTTFFNLLTGFDKPNSGGWTFDGTPLAGLPSYRVARLGMVRTFQLTKALARLTVIDNMRLGADGAPPAPDARRADGGREPGAGADDHRPRRAVARGRAHRALRRARHGRRAHHQRLGGGDERGRGHRRGTSQRDRDELTGHRRVPGCAPRHPARPGRAGPPARRGAGPGGRRAAGQARRTRHRRGDRTVTVDTDPVEDAGSADGRAVVLEATEVVAGYIPGVNILSGTNLQLHDGELVGVIGLKAHELVSRGIGYVPQVENVFPRLSIEENLQMGVYQTPKRFDERFEVVATMFPRLAARRKQRAGSLSGGERQMLSMGRALMADPQVLLLDEPSAGLSPALQDEVFINCRRINDAGVSIVMVEQNANRCLQICHRGYVLDQGRNAYTDTGQALLTDPKVIELYLGTLAQVD